MNFTIKDTKVQIQKGDRFRVINTKNCNGWGYGEIVIAETASKSGKFVAKSIISGIPNNVHIGIHVERIGSTKEEIKDKINQIEKEKEDLKARLSFMDKNSLEELDEKRYLTYVILSEINKNSPAEDKEEVINELLERSYEV